MRGVVKRQFVSSTTIMNETPDARVEVCCIEISDY